ncbi:hypothetical protein ACFLZM_00960 [Thermodesulfobacteriota bacterium]
MIKPPVKGRSLFILGIFLLFSGANLIAFALAFSSPGLQRKLGVFGLCMGVVGLVFALIGSRPLAIHHSVTDLLMLPLAGIMVCLLVFMPSLLAMDFLGKLILANGTAVALVLALLVSRRYGFRGS